MEVMEREVSRVYTASVAANVGVEGPGPEMLGIEKSTSMLTADIDVGIFHQNIFLVLRFVYRSAGVVTDDVVSVVSGEFETSGGKPSTVAEK